MDDSAAKSLAIVIRPLFREVASTLELPDGILGVVLAPPNATDGHTYFAEFVGPTYGSSTIEELELRASHYQLAAHNVLSGVLLYAVLESEGELPPAILDMKQVAWSQLVDVSQPLRSLFGDSLPEQVLLHRVWLKQPLSMLYYIPKGQHSPDEWKALVRTNRFVACLLRMSMVIVSAADLVDATNVQPVMECLPTLFADHELRLAKVVADGVALKARALNDWRNLNCRIEYVAHKNQLEFTAKALDGSIAELVSLQCTRGALFSGQKGGNLINCPEKQREMKHTLAFFMLRKAQQNNHLVHYRDAHSFFCSGAEAASASKTRARIASHNSMEVENGPPTNVSRLNRMARDLIRQRVNRAEAHMRKLINVADPIRYFDRNSGGTYCFGPDVEMGPQFAKQLAEALKGKAELSFFADMAKCCNCMAVEGEE